MGGLVPGSIVDGGGTLAQEPLKPNLPYPVFSLFFTTEWYGDGTFPGVSVFYELSAGIYLPVERRRRIMDSRNPKVFEIVAMFLFRAL